MRLSGASHVTTAPYVRGTLEALQRQVFSSRAELIRALQLSRVIRRNVLQLSSTPAFATPSRMSAMSLQVPWSPASPASTLARDLFQTVDTRTRKE